VGICAICTSGGMQLTWYPLIRDSSYYVIVLVILAIFFGVHSPNIIDWYEALILHLMYWLYVFLMFNNNKSSKYFSSNAGELSLLLLL
jgi:Ca2+/Na+ antiporter